MMAILNFWLSSPNLISDPTTNTAVKKISLRTCNITGAVPYLRNKRHIQLPEVASTSSPQIDVDDLRSEFRTTGVTFTGIGNSCVVRMELKNGTAAKLMVPSGLITSFKTPMWHGATMELLHTSVSESENSAAVIQGGLSLALCCKNDAGVSWCPNAWALYRVNATPQESIQVELISTSVEANAEVRHIITLQRDLLNSEIIVSNRSSSSLYLMGSAICHLAVSTPDAAYIVGLEGSDYIIRPPFEADFSIIPPDFKKTVQYPRKFRAVNKLFPEWGVRNRNVKDDVWSLGQDIKEDLVGEEEDNYKHLTEKLSRIYTRACRSLTIIDRGKRNSVTMRRHGFEELYILSPGSEHEWYNKYSYICIGHAAQLEPVILNAQGEWRGGLRLWNPNS